MEKRTVLVVGGGGREHAIVQAVARSPLAGKIYCAPGNPGIAELAECVPIAVDQFDDLVDMAKSRNVDLAIIGPDDPLAAGIVDRFQAAGLTVFGPTAAAARIESSKVFSKGFMQKNSIPTARHAVFDDPNEARAYVHEQGVPIVLKADGLALGKGVIIANTEEEASAAIATILEEKKFGAAGNRLLVEEHMAGEEATVLCFCDGEHIVPMVSAQDHKRIFDDDQGPNTGGMGTYSPAPVITPEMSERVRKEILEPTMAGMQTEGCPFVGFLYAELMITADGPKVIEYNARMGDPEAQVVLARLKTDLVAICEACIDGTMDQVKLDWDPRAAVCVVASSAGYPGSYAKGVPIQIDAKGLAVSGGEIIHAGTALKDGQLVTAGGRVLGAVALGEGIKEAIDRAYQTMGAISFEGMHYRNDIGYRALARMKNVNS